MGGSSQHALGGSTGGQGTNCRIFVRQNYGWGSARSWKLGTKDTVQIICHVAPVVRTTLVPTAGSGCKHHLKNRPRVLEGIVFLWWGPSQGCSASPQAQLSPP
ncbi:unnamed protein product [Ectocarpus sp. 13 AM-2016]